MHKGFQLHFIQSRQPDGLWITKMVEGNADFAQGCSFIRAFVFKKSFKLPVVFGAIRRDAIDARDRSEALGRYRWTRSSLHILTRDVVELTRRASVPGFGFVRYRHSDRHFGWASRAPACRLYNASR